MKVKEAVRSCELVMICRRFSVQGRRHATREVTVAICHAAAVPLLPARSHFLRLQNLNYHPVSTSRERETVCKGVDGPDDPNVMLVLMVTRSWRWKRERGQGNGKTGARAARRLAVAFTKTKQVKSREKDSWMTVKNTLQLGRALRNQQRVCRILMRMR